METLPSVVNKVIKTALIKKLGIALATLIILQNSKTYGIMVATINHDEYIKLVNAIIQDKRVIRVFNKKQIKALKTKWLKQAM